MILGITGSIACGKSKVTEYIKQKGYKVISLDDISHEIFGDVDVNNKIKEIFGIKKEGLVTRSEVATAAFGSEILLKQLDNLLHPLILKVMNEEINKARLNNEHLFVEVPLLFEAALESYFDKVILVYVDKKTQLARLMERNGFTEEQAMIRINCQMDIKKKIRKAKKQKQFLIDNNKDLDYTYKATDKILDIINNSINKK